MDKQSKRIGYIDIMKAIGIICVIIGHYWAPSIVGDIIWSFHMPLFVVISGYFLKGPIDLHRLKKMISNYILPYTIVWGINAVLLSAQNMLTHTFSYQWVKQYLISYFWALGSNATLHKPEYVIKVGVIWFLMALFWGEFLIHILLKISGKCIVHLIYISILWIAAYLISNRICVPLGITNGISFLPWLYTGYCIKKYKKNIQNISGVAKYGVILSAILWGSMLYIQHKYGWRFSIAEYQIKKFCVGYIGAMAGINIIRLLAIGLDNNCLKMRKRVIQIGQATIWILCVHGIGIEIVSPYLNSLSNINGIISMLIRLILDILIALGLKNIWNHLKMRNMQNEKSVKKNRESMY